jgi:hypothetical protein
MHVRLCSNEAVGLLALMMAFLILLVKTYIKPVVIKRFSRRVRVQCIACDNLFVNGISNMKE